ncbi:MAG TPA: serine/threonine-protein kinase, partial [Kofleriaceae bacterium]|nr:serine/threonine-protein kinase [Kofleriaceae bacterium]
MIEALGRYELLRMLGRGGMAEVYLARRRVAGLEKRLVVKRIRRERAGDPALLDLFMREARVSMSLGHQNVVPVFDFGRVGDDAFLAMEYVDGRDLGSTLARAARPMPPLLAAYVASECCRALDHAHHRRTPEGGPAGVIHRDVTPRNVLLSWAGEVKLADFGVATLAGDGDAQVRGTWAYMAPEQARGEPIDGRADLYALGLVLWSMLAGTRPRPGDDPEALRALATSGELPALPAGPPALVAVIARATAREREQRHADAHELQEALEAYLIGARAETPGPSPERQLAAWMAEVWGDEARRGEPGVAVPLEVLTADRTQRSAAATVADEDEAEGAGPAAVVPDVAAAARAPTAAPPAGAQARPRSRRLVAGAAAVAAG